MKIEVDTKGLNNSLAKLKTTLSDMTSFFKVSGQIILSSVNRNFMAGGRPSWKPLSPVTIKRRRGPGNPQILRDTDYLMTSIGARTGKGVYRLTPHSIEVGTSVDYASIHQYGTRYIPARPFMVVQDKDVDDIVKVALEMIDKAIK